MILCTIATSSVNSHSHTQLTRGIVTNSEIRASSKRRRFMEIFTHVAPPSNGIDSGECHPYRIRLPTGRGRSTRGTQITFQNQTRWSFPQLHTGQQHGSLICGPPPPSLLVRFHRRRHHSAPFVHRSQGTIPLNFFRIPPLFMKFRAQLNNIHPATSTIFSPAVATPYEVGVPRYSYASDVDPAS